MKIIAVEIKNTEWQEGENLSCVLEVPENLASLEVLGIAGEILARMTAEIESQQPAS